MYVCINITTYIYVRTRRFPEDNGFEQLCHQIQMASTEAPAIHSDTDNSRMGKNWLHRAWIELYFDI
jgi:hypothetical protein